MSRQRKPTQIPLVQLKPQWVEFTSTRGVLRCLKPQEDKARAQGLVFDCPRCRHSKQKAHYCIFLFENAPPEARPLGRFFPTETSDGEGVRRPVGFSVLSLAMRKNGYFEAHLAPADMRCHWQGELHDGIVSWRPSFIERALRKL